MKGKQQISVESGAKVEVIQPAKRRRTRSTMVQPSKNITGPKTNSITRWTPAGGNPQKPKLTPKKIDPEPKDWSLDWAGPRGETPACLTFSPTAWAKVQYFRDNVNEVEVCGFGVSHPENPLTVIDFVLIKQSSQAAFTAMDDDAIADHLEDNAEAGVTPEECCRIWIHTHPGMSPTPSSHDEMTFEKTFKPFPWSVMAIVSNGESSYARIKLERPISFSTRISVKVDYSIPVEPIDYDELATLYKKLVTPYKYVRQGGNWNQSFYYDESKDDEFYPFGTAYRETGYGSGCYDYGAHRRTTSQSSWPTSKSQEKLETSSKDSQSKASEEDEITAECPMCEEEWDAAFLDENSMCPDCLKILEQHAITVSMEPIKETEEDQETEETEIESIESENSVEINLSEITGEEEE